MLKKPSRSLSAGAKKSFRELMPFKQNTSLYITLYNLILDNYIRVRSAFQAMYEVFLFIVEVCYPEQLNDDLYQQSSPALFEQVHKKLFFNLMHEHYIQAFR